MNLIFIISIIWICEYLPQSLADAFLPMIYDNCIKLEMFLSFEVAIFS